MDDKLKNSIEKMVARKEEGFNEVYSETYNRVYFRARQIMKNEEDALDLVQIVFVEAYKNISSLQASDALFSWLDGITYRQGMKIFRKKKDVLLTEEAEGLFDTLENNDTSIMPEINADQKATSEIIMGIIEELPELQKVAVIAYYYDGLKVDHIADIMACSVGTIKSRLNYARKYIKDRVEEKEKKEGYQLHAFGLPVLWFSIKMLSEKTTLTVEAAQSVYNTSCVTIGLQAGTIHAATVAITAGQTVGGTANAAGIGAKIAALSIKAKALLLAGTIATGGLGIAGTTYVVNENLKEESQYQTEDLSSGRAESEVSSAGSTIAAAEDNKNDDTQEELAVQAEAVEQSTQEKPEEITELSVTAQHQISAFLGAMDNHGSDLQTVEADHCMWLLQEYLNDCGQYADEANADDVPFQWKSGIVSKEEFNQFFGAALGIEIPEGFVYSINDPDYTFQITDSGLEIEMDGSLYRAKGGTVNITDFTDGIYTLSGTFDNGDCTEPLIAKTFTATAEESGDATIFDGLRILSFEVQ